MATGQALRDRALDSLVRGDTAGGIGDLKAYLDGAPTDAGGWLALGAAYAAIDHLADALGALGRAIAIDGSREARLARARTLGRMGRLDEAALDLIEAARGGPADARVLRELGVVRYEQGRLDEARAALIEAVTAAPDDARARYALGVVEEARRDVGAALAAYREAVRLDPTLVDARRTLADALAGLGEHEAAIAELGAILAIDPSDASAAKNRAVLTRALAEMERGRLLGKGEEELFASALVTEGGLRKKGAIVGEGSKGGRAVIRWAAPLFELHASLDDEVIVALHLALTDPARVARAVDDTLGITVIGADGQPRPVDRGTALTLTFLREAAGCPLTQASAIYARLLGGEAVVVWAGAVIGWEAWPRPGLVVRRPIAPAHSIGSTPRSSSEQ